MCLFLSRMRYLECLDSEVGKKVENLASDMRILWVQFQGFQCQTFRGLLSLVASWTHGRMDAWRRGGVGHCRNVRLLRLLLPLHTRSWDGCSLHCYMITVNHVMCESRVNHVLPVAMFGGPGLQRKACRIQTTVQSKFSSCRRCLGQKTQSAVLSITIDDLLIR